MYKDFKIIANLGDVNPIDHGGFFVLERLELSFPCIEYWVEPQSDDKIWKIYRWDINQFVYEQQYCGDIKEYFHGEYSPILIEGEYSNHVPWFEKDLNNIAQSVGIEKIDLINLFCSRDIIKRAQAYKIVVGYWGAANFDEHPVELTYKEINKRYKELEKVMVK